MMTNYSLSTLRNTKMSRVNFVAVNYLYIKILCKIYKLRWPYYLNYCEYLCFDIGIVTCFRLACLMTPH